MSTHCDPLCTLDSNDGPCWVGLLDHFLEYDHEPPIDADTLTEIERLRCIGGEVVLTGGALAKMVLRIQPPVQS